MTETVSLQPNGVIRLVWVIWWCSRSRKFCDWMCHPAFCLPVVDLFSEKLWGVFFGFHAELSIRSFFIGCSGIDHIHRGLNTLKEKCRYYVWFVLSKKTNSRWSERWPGLNFQILIKSHNKKYPNINPFTPRLKWKHPHLQGNLLICFSTYWHISQGSRRLPMSFQYARRSS